AGKEAFAGDLEETRCLAVEDGGRLVAVGQGTRIEVYDPRARKRVRVLEGHETGVSDLAFDQSGTVLASASRGDGTARLWNLSTGEALAALDTGQKSLTHVTLSPTGRWLATGDSEGQVRLWDLALLRRELKEAGLDWPAPPLQIAPDRGAVAHLEAGMRHHL